MNTDEKIKNILKGIKIEYHNHKSKGQDYEAIKSEINSLNEDELITLNENLNLTKSYLNEKLNEATTQKIPFIEFILKTKNIELDIFESNNETNSSFVSLYTNENFSDETKEYLASFLFSRFRDKDFQYFKHQKEKLLRFRILDFITKKGYHLKDDDNGENRIYNFLKLIETSKCKDYNVYYGNYIENHVVQITNNSIRWYKENWNYIDKAFNKFGFYKEIYDVDKDNKIKTKLDKLKSENIEFDKDIYGVPIHDLMVTFYPEIFED